ncbi:autotransporter outer membrane beta-barrel domain-containing protein [Solemya velum gill symbiont]|uniref:autotransporter family protein n=1 Tax=Solemya velum gill symbiont TaxID=2340 RepID=UPI0018A87D0C|nr:autotransporter outer membrane beta-barrel domain-containing protein [Solemya velum gill symbiont]
MHTTTTTDNCSLDDGEGIEITETGKVEGSSQAISAKKATSISNAGVISSNTGNGIYANHHSDFSDGISNTGTIKAGSDGVYIDFHSNISGGLHNIGTITAGNDGIRITTSNITGLVRNDGIINAGSNGFFLSSDSDISGGIDNSGDISGEANGIHLYSGPFSSKTTDISGGVLNQEGGTISGGNNGFFLYSDSDISGGIDNSGDISGEANGIHLYSGTSSRETTDISGGVLNQEGGYISGGNNGIYLSYNSDINGIYLSYNSDISGGINNSGTISGGDSALNLGSGNNRVINYGLLDGSVILGDWSLDIKGTESRITRETTGSNNSIVNLDGTFTSENTFDVGTFNILEGGVLNQKHGITTASGFNNNGTLAIADGDTSTITGNYTQQADGVIRTGATSSSSGRLNVTGTADISASGKFDVQVSANDQLSNGDTLDNVLSAGTLVSADNLSVTDNSALWKFSAVNDGNNGIDFVAQYNELVSMTEVSSWATGVAGEIDALYKTDTATGDMATVMGELNALSDRAGVAGAIQQFVPTLADSAHKTSVLSTTGQVARVMQGQVLGSTSLSSGDSFTERGLWLRPFYQDAEQKKHDGVDGDDADTRGLVLGVDGRLSEQWKLGLGLAYSDTNVGGKDQVNGQNLDVASYELIGLAHYTPRPDDFINFTAATGKTRIDSLRNIQFGGIARTASAEHDGWYAQLEVEAGRHFRQNERLTLTPTIKVNYIHIDEEGYTETGADAFNLQVDKTDSDVLLLGIGGEVDYQPVENKPLFLNAHLGVAYDVLSEQNVTTSTLTGGGSRFTTNGLDADPLVIQGGVGVRMVQDNGLTLDLNYDIETREVYLSQIVSVNLKYLF